MMGSGPTMQGPPYLSALCTWCLLLTLLPSLPTPHPHPRPLPNLPASHGPSGPRQHHFALAFPDHPPPACGFGTPRPGAGTPGPPGCPLPPPPLCGGGGRGPPPPPPGRGPEGRPPPTPLPQTGGPCPGSPPAAACLRATPPQHSPLGPRGWRKACLPRVSCAICPHHRTSHQGCQPAAVRELSFTWAVAGLSSYLSTHHGLWYLLSSSPTSEQWGEGSGLGWGEWGRGAVAGAGRGWREQGKRQEG